VHILPLLTFLAHMLKIVRVEAIPVVLPLAKPVVMAGERVESARNLMVRIEAADGALGWGEAGSAPLMTGELLGGMVEAIERHLAPCVVGADALDYAVLAQKCARALAHNASAKSALDMAIHDLAGRHLGKGIAGLYGGAQREELRPLYMLGNPRVADDIAEARRKMSEGYRFFKLKIGIKPPKEEGAAAAEIRNALGAEVALCADANMGLTFESACEFAAYAREAKLLFLEQPLSAEDFDGMARLARATTLPLNGDESIDSVRSLRELHRLGAIQGAGLKLIKLGGIGAAVRAMSVCAELGLHINLACKTGESSVAAAAVVQLASIAPNLDWGVSITQHYLAEDVVESPLKMENGKVRLPRGPGLGVEVDEAKVRRFALK
jgi:L-alanine-DL-glutamate epimerase-like enolase superfamily enzyme